MPGDGPDRRRRLGIGATLVVGAGLLWGALAAAPGSALFYGLGLASAATWVTGAVVVGPVSWRSRAVGAWPGWVLVMAAVGLGAALFGVFAVAKVVGEQVPVLSDSVARVLVRADTGPRFLQLAVALVNGVGEEMFFRGAVQSAVGRRRAVLWTTAIYTAVTMATLEPALVAAALVMGVVFAVEKRMTGGLWAPVLTHLTWSTLVLFLLPR